MPRVFTVTMSDGPAAAAFAALDDAERERAIGLGLPLLDAALTAVEGVADGAWGKRRTSGIAVMRGSLATANI